MHFTDCLGVDPNLPAIAFEIGPYLLISLKIHDGPSIFFSEREVGNAFNQQAIFHL